MKFLQWTMISYCATVEAINQGMDTAQSLYAAPMTLLAVVGDLAM